MTGLRSFNDSTNKRVLDLLKTRRYCIAFLCICFILVPWYGV